MSATKAVPRIKQSYQQEVVPRLLKERGYPSVMAVPRLTKVVVNMAWEKPRRTSSCSTRRSTSSLNLMGKRINRVEAYERGIQKLHDAGIGVYASFVYGYDYDDPSVFDEFLEFAERNRIEGAFLPLLTPFPGTRIYQRLKQEGRILTEDWSKYDMATVVFQPKRMTVEELQEGFWKVNRSFYSIPSMLKRIFHPFHMRRSLIIFGPMNLGLWPAVKKAERYFKLNC